MDKKKKSNLVKTLKGIVKEALNLVEVLKPKVEQDTSPSNKEFGAIQKLLKQSEDALSEANKQGKQRRKQQINELEQLIEDLSSALGTPGLDEIVREDLKDLRRRKRAQLLRLQTKEALDFGGILTTKQIKEIDELLKKAKQEVAKKKKAAALLMTLMKLADIGLSIAGKAANVAV